MIDYIFCTRQCIDLTKKMLFDFKVVCLAEHLHQQQTVLEGKKLSASHGKAFVFWLLQLHQSAFSQKLKKMKIKPKVPFYLKMWTNSSSSHTT